MGELIKVADKKDLPTGKAIAVDVQGKRVALFNIDNHYYAIDDECTHAGGNLSEGSVEGTKVTCPWHGASFNLTNGEVLQAPASDNLNCYKVTVDGDDVKIEV